MSTWHDLESWLSLLEIDEGEAVRITLERSGWVPSFACGSPFPSLPVGAATKAHVVSYVELALAERYERLARDLRKRAMSRPESKDLIKLGPYWGLR